MGPEAAAVKATLTLARSDTLGVVRTHISDWAEVWIIEEGEWKLLVASESTDWIDL